jgi:hypothetical protein
VNQYGQIAFDEWMKLPERYPNLELDVFQIMPNHIHAIILLTNPATVGATLAVAPIGNTVAPNGNTVAPNGNMVAPNGNTVAPNGNMVAPNGDDITPIANDIIRAGVNPAPTGVSDIVGAYKSLVANGCSI